MKLNSDYNSMEAHYGVSFKLADANPDTIKEALNRAEKIVEKRLQTMAKKNQKVLSSLAG